jgi:hypothetical protein
MQCIAIKADGMPCQRIASGYSNYCHAHDPAYAEERHANASKAAQAKGNAELRRLKREVHGVIADIKAGRRDRNDGTAILQGYRVLRELIELERRVLETDELARGIEELKEAL